MVPTIQKPSIALLGDLRVAQVETTVLEHELLFLNRLNVFLLEECF